MKIIFIIATLLLFFSTASMPSDKPATVILLKETSGELSFEKLEIADNETKVFMDSSIVTVILPLGEGKSGDFIKKSDRGDALTIKNTRGTLNVSFKSPDGKVSSFPDINTEDLKKYDIRLNITGFNGFKKAYTIKNYDLIKEDDGLVLDIFAGQMSIDEGDYSLLLESSLVKTEAGLTGKIPFIRDDKGWILVKGSFAGGKSGYFIVDFGATGTVVTKDYIPAGIEINMPTSIQYSENGEEKVKVKMQGANDTVSTQILLGKTSPSSLGLDGLTINDVSVRVITKFPEGMSGKNEIAGILGMDVIRRAGTIVFSGLNSANGEAHIILGEDLQTGENQISVPFQNAGSFVLFDGKISGSKIKFIVDTGARYTIVSEKILDKLSASYTSTGETRELRGMEGKPVIGEVILSNLEMGGKEFPDTRLVMSEVAAINAMGLQEDIMLMGIDFLGKFGYAGFDFNSNILTIF